VISVQSCECQSEVFRPLSIVMVGFQTADKPRVPVRVNRLPLQEAVSMPLRLSAEVLAMLSSPSYSEGVLTIRHLTLKTL
jgi:hypothetical protein